MLNRKIAVLSDIHGNSWALSEVLEDIKNRGIREMVNLGDCFYGPLDPAGTAKILIKLGIPTVRGNEDRILTEDKKDMKPSHTRLYTKRSLTAQSLEWLNTLPITMVPYSDFFMFHGTLVRDDEYFLVKVAKNNILLEDSAKLQSSLAPVKQKIILCGHDHVPRMVQLPNGQLIINPGSVGLPAYTDDLPWPHVMENGSPHARYSIIHQLETGWKVENIAVPYNWKAAIDVALKNKRPDWARWLQTGRAG